MSGFFTLLTEIIEQRRVPSPGFSSALAEVVLLTMKEEAAIARLLASAGLGDAELTERSYARANKLAALRRLEETGAS